MAKRIGGLVFSGSSSLILITAAPPSCPHVVCRFRSGCRLLCRRADVFVLAFLSSFSFLYAVLSYSRRTELSPPFVSPCFSQFRAPGYMAEPVLLLITGRARGCS